MKQTQNLREHGDPLERAYAEWIGQRLPAYASLWATFIGNDGTSQPPLQSQLPQAEASRRAATAVGVYTTLESALCAQRLVESARSLVIEGQPGPANVTAYVDSINVFVAFFAHLGRIRDGLERVGSLWKDPRLSQDFDDYYKQRNVILHEAKVPNAVIDRALAIVPPEGSDYDSEKWGKGRTWLEARALQPVRISVLLERILDEALRRLNSSFARLESQHLWPTLQSVADLAALFEQSNRPQATTFMVTGILLFPSFDENGE